MVTATVVARTPSQRDELIISHLPLVHFVARKLTRRFTSGTVVEYDDLVGYGTEGLIAAIATFNPVHNVRFSSWAVLHIRTTIQDALRALDPLPRSVRTKGKAIEQVSTAFAHQHGHWPTEAQVAHELGVTPDKLHTTRQQLAYRTVSLNQGDDGSGAEPQFSPLSTLADADPEGDPQASLDMAQNHLLLLDAVMALPAREALVVRLYYREGASMRMIAQALNVSESRISQLHGRAIQLLRETLTRTRDDSPRQAA